MRIGHMRYFVQFESDRMTCGSHDHTAGNASTLKSAKSIIARIKRELKEENPRNFRVYDRDADIEEETGFVPCVYSEN